MALLENTLSPDQIDSAQYDAIYFTGGHAVMYDFPDSEGLQRITREALRARRCRLLGLPRLLRPAQHPGSPTGPSSSPARG
ncbi:hypothetical protein [Nocardioides convexus]|uniref:hypothetical protein n=1 Tax=Nocardioides convexus TaxID=2712224 RepID=UPI002418402E|nr:hypothetical protein [Nocardioides convexus]